MDGGISLQINELETKLILPRFLVEGLIKAVGNIENTFNDERYNFVNLHHPVVTPWHQTNPLKPLSMGETTVKVEEVLLAYPTDPADQAEIPKMPTSQRGILYLGDFVVHGDVSMGNDMDLSTAIDGINKRFIVLTDATIFPLFPAAASIQEVMPIVLVNRSKVYQSHAEK